MESTWEERRCDSVVGSSLSVIVRQSDEVGAAAGAPRTKLRGSRGRTSPRAVGKLLTGDHTTSTCRKHPLTGINGRYRARDAHHEMLTCCMVEEETGERMNLGWDPHERVEGV